MCGLFGIALNYSMIGDQEKQAFKNLSFISATRGFDSTGFARITRNVDTKKYGVNLIKSALDPITFSKADEVKSFLRYTNIKALMGHTRFKTRGDVVSENAHPFRSEDGRFILFHNGTLNNMHKGYDTDSEWLCNKIAENNGDLSKVLPDVYGAYALVLIDTLEDSISFIRNKERPLWYILRGKDFFYASEPWMLSSLSLLPAKELPIHTLMKLTYNEEGGMSISESKVDVTRFSGYGGWGGGSWESLEESRYSALDRLFPLEPIDDDPPFETKQDRGTKESKVFAVVGTEGNGAQVVSPEQFKQKREEKAREAAAGATKSRGILKFTYDRNGLSYSSKDFDELGLTEEQKDILFSTSEDFVVKIDGVWIETMRNKFISLNDFEEILNKDCCSWCAQKSLKSDNRIWFKKTEYVCDTCQPSAQEYMN